MSIERAAKSILTHLEAVYVPAHRYVPAKPEDFDYLDLRFYDSAREHLAERGFTFLGDLEDETLSAAPGSVLRPALIRAMASSDGTVSVGIYHAKFKFWPGMFRFLLRGNTSERVIDLETEYTDGSLVMTSTARAAKAMDLPPQVFGHYVSNTRSMDELLTLHEARMRAHSDEYSSAVARQCRTLDDVLDSQARLTALKAAHRRALGGVTLAELERASTIGRPLAREVHEEITRLRSRDNP